MQIENKTCRLCGTDTKLCESHIIPEFFYKPIYEPGHVFYRFSSVDERAKKSYKGLKQKLFCKSCEDIFHEFENYIAPIWASEEIKYRNENGISYIMGLDYRLFKLFQMSIIWRASVSTLPEFGNIKLGEKHETSLREMLLNKIPAKPYQYSCVIVHANDSKMQQFINSSMFIFPSFKQGGHRVYPFVFGALIWFFYVSSHLYDALSFKVLSENGELPIIHDPKIAERLLLLSANSIHSNKKKVM